MPVECPSLSDQPNLTIEKKNLELPDGDDSTHVYRFFFVVNGDDALLETLLEKGGLVIDEEGLKEELRCHQFEKDHEDEEDLIYYPEEFFYGMSSCELVHEGLICIAVRHQNVKTASDYLTQFLLNTGVNKNLIAIGDDDYVGSCKFVYRYESLQGNLDIEFLYQDEMSYFKAMDARNESAIDDEKLFLESDDCD